MNATSDVHARTRFLGPAVLALVLSPILGLAACGGEPGSADPAGQAGAGAEGGMDEMSHGDAGKHDRHGKHERGDHGGGGDHAGGHNDESGHGSGHASGHGASHDAAALDPALVGVADLPAGYRKGAGHLHTPSTAAAPDLGPGCAAIGELIGTAPSVQQREHPQASATFTKGHFGPQVTETLIDYGDEASAAEALSRVERSSEECDRYVQSTSPVGANAYTVRSSVPGWSGPEGTTLRLTAVSSDFEGLHWDIWVTRADSLLAAVTLRSVAGGSNEDLAPSINAARAALER